MSVSSYHFFLSSHHWISNLLYILLVATLFYAIYLRIKRSSFNKTADKLSLITLILADTMLLLGLVLFFFGNNGSRALANDDFAVVMKDKYLRYHTIEHPTTMLLSIILLHIARIKIKKTVDGEKKLKKAILWFSIVFILMTITYPWGFRNLSTINAIF